MKKYIIIIGLIGLILPVKVLALTGSVDVKCASSTLKANSETTCTLTGTTSEAVSSVDMKIVLGSNLTLTSITKDSSWEGSIETDGDIKLYTDNNKTNTFNIATFKIKSANITGGATTTIKVKDVVFSDASFTEHNISEKVLNIRIPSTINTLKNIKIDDKEIEGFSSTKTDYNISVASTVTSLKIDATANDTNAEIDGTGTKTVKYGENKYTIKVTSEEGISKSYNVTVVKPEIRELSNLKINGEEIKLVSGKYEYNLTVKNEITSLKVETVLNDSTNVSFVDNYGPREIKDINVGNNEILIKTKDSNNEELTYKVIVNRLNAEGKSIEKEDNKTTSNPKTGPISIIGVSFILIIASAIYIKVRKINIFPSNIK